MENFKLCLLATNRLQILRNTWSGKQWRLLRHLSWWLSNWTCEQTSSYLWCKKYEWVQWWWSTWKNFRCAT